MRKLLAALALFLVPGCASIGISDPAPTVRLLRSDGRQVCSAVVVKPEVAMTAKHCVSEPNLTVDDFAVGLIFPVDDSDLAVLGVPGLQCPCAPIGKRPAVGSPVKAIGFPGALNGKQRVTDEVAVKLVGPASAIFPWLDIPGLFIYTEQSVLAPGDSGGGLFQFQFGGWRLIGINSHIISSNPMIPVPYTSGFAAVFE